MDSQKRTDDLFDRAKKLGLDNPMTDDGAPTREMVAEAISDAEGDALACKEQADRKAAKNRPKTQMVHNKNKTEGISG